MVSQKDSILFVSHIVSYIKIYDIETGQSTGDMSYSVEKIFFFESRQSNS